MSAEWHGRGAFHEIAEAVGTSTDLVMAYNPQDRFVLFSREDDPELLYMARIERDADGIMRAHDVAARPGLLQSIMARVDDEMRREMGS